MSYKKILLTYVGRCVQIFGLTVKTITGNMKRPIYDLT